jgi:hypothetical protein
VTFGDDRVGYVTTYLALGATDPQPFSHPGVHPVDGRAGGGQVAQVGARSDQQRIEARLLQPAAGPVHPVGKILVGSHRLASTRSCP